MTSLTINVAGAWQANAPWGVEWRVGRALEELGHRGLRSDPRSAAGLDALVQQVARPADLFVACRGDGLPPGLVWQLQAPTVLWTCEQLVGGSDHAASRRAELAAIASAYDHIVVHEPAAGRVALGLGPRAPVKVLSCAAIDPLVQRRRDLPLEHDVTFVGSLTPRRRRFLQRLSSHTSRSVFVAQVHDPAALNELYARSRVVLNLHCTDEPNTETRVAEVLGAGAFLLSEELSWPDLFEEGEEFVSFPAGDVEACGAALERYLRDADARQQIADAGYRTVHARHRWTDRMEQLLGSLELSPAEAYWPATTLGCLFGPDGRLTRRVDGFRLAVARALVGPGDE